MKRLLSFLSLLICTMWQMQADTVVGSSTQPGDGRPEHLYTMVNGNGTYANDLTHPSSGEDDHGLFAFYAVSGKTNMYYIYSYNAKKWLTYTPAASYSNGKSFVNMSDTRSDNAYFLVNNYSGDKFEIQPVTTGGSGNLYLNWYQGVGANSGLTLGLWQDNGSKDLGSSWTFAEVVFRTYTYTINLPEGGSITIAGNSYANGSTYTCEGSLNKSDITVPAQEGKFSVVSIDDVNQTITVRYGTIPVQPEPAVYTNAVLYPAQQDAVGTAVLTKDGDVYTLNNNVLAASFVKVGDALYFAGSTAMNLQPGTEPFTVAFGAGDNVPASAMTLTSIETMDLTPEANAVGGAEHYNGKALVAHYTYTYNGATINILWKAVLRDGSHYLRTEMELTGVDDVDMYNVIPMAYNVDCKAAGSTPVVVGNTRGAVLMSNKIFAGLENPVGYNTVGEASGAEDLWEETSSTAENLTATSWTTVASDDVPNRVVEATGANYPNLLAYTKSGVALTEGQKVEITVKYTGGNHRLNFGGADLLDAEGNIAASDYHSGYSGNEQSNNTFTFSAPYNGTFSLRVFVEKATEDVDASSTMTVKVYTPKAGAEVNTELVGIQGRWSRNTTLAAGETWKISAVVGLVAQDGEQANADIHKTQKRRSFLAYSERERAVPWRPNPAYISWYELNIDRNNAADPTNNMNANQVLDVLNHWKSDFFDVYGVGPCSFVIDDGWDNYGTWTFHSGFPNEMRDMAAKAAEMGAGVGAWLGPVGGYGTSGNYRRAYWRDKGGMVLSNPAYYQTFLAAAENLTKNQGDFRFFKFDGISAQFSSVGPDAGDTGNENAEGIIRLERYVRENLKRDIFFNTTVGTWASPFWYHYTDATWRQEGDYGESGNNSIDREKWITYRDRLVYQNYVKNSPICPINTLMTHGFILTRFGAVSKNMSYDACLRELRCAFLCGSGMVELYNDYELMNSINGGKLWADLAECIAWQKSNADVLPDAHWVGGNPWTGSAAEVYGWASWNGTKATLALRNGANNAQTYTFTLREALNIPANVTGSMYFKRSFNVQDPLTGFNEATAIDYDTPITVTLPGSSVFGFDGSTSAVDLPLNSFNPTEISPANSSTLESLSAISLTFPAEVGHVEATALDVKDASNNVVTTATLAINNENAAVVDVTLAEEIASNGTYRITIPEGFIYDAGGKTEGATYNPEVLLSYTIRVLEDYAINFDRDATATRTDRFLNSVTLTEEGQDGQTITPASPKPYTDLSADENAILTCKAGSTLTATFDYTGTWMHGYVYIDLDHSKQFSYNEGNTDQSGTELLAFAFYSGDFNNDASGVNSLGQSITGNNRANINPPSFTAPAEAGTYRIRFKVDWNSVDPGGQLAANGTATGANGILANGGAILDATLRVTGTNTGITGAENGNGEARYYDLSGRRLNAAPARGVYIKGNRKVVK